MSAPKTEILGKHLIADLWGGSPGRLDSEDLLREALLVAAESGHFSVLGVHVHSFSPQGVTGVLLLAESHISIHTWPEHRYAAVDIFSCGGDPWAALAVLKEKLQIEHSEIRELDRGIL